MTALLTRALDLVYPPRCAGCREATSAPHGLCGPCWRETRFISGPVCRLCGQPTPLASPGLDIVCEGCTHAPPGWDAGRAAILYEGTGRRVVLALKHGDRLDLTRTAARWMAQAGGDVTARAEIIAPIPLHWSRFVRRRYNQAAELARQPALSTTAKRIPDLLTRIKPTPPQEGMDRETRFATQRDAIRVTERHAPAIAGKHVLLVDDVMTSGATLGAATAALRPAQPASISVLVLARVASAWTEAI